MWYGNGTTINIKVPDVISEKRANFWIQFVSNKIGIPITSWMRPHEMIIQPNIMHEESPIIYDFNPTKGQATFQLWISGMNFSPLTTQVSIGNMKAVIYSCSDTHKMYNSSFKYSSKFR